MVMMYGPPSFHVNAIWLGLIALILQLLPPVVSIPSPVFITREVGQYVVFMFNITNILTFNWGIRNDHPDYTEYLKQGFIRYDKDDSNGITLDKNLNSSSYAGRVSFVGDLTKGQAWFKITNLNINDTNQYMAKMYIAAGYQYFPVKLNVVQPTTTIKPPSTRLTPTNLTPTNHSSQSLTTVPATVNPSTFPNQTICIKVVKEVFDDLSDVNSTAFKKVRDQFVSEINSAYRSVTNYNKVKVTSLSENSIPVKFVVYFKNEISSNDACAPLQLAIKDNRLGSLEIVPDSLEGCSNEPTTTFTKTQPSSDSKFTSIIVTCVTVIFVLLAVVVFLLIYIWKGKVQNEKATKRRSSSLTDKELSAYENTHQVQGASESRALETIRPVTEKDTYETINVNKGEYAITDFKEDSLTGPEITISMPQHYQELKRKTPLATPLYEPLSNRNIGKKESGADDPKTYEQLQQNAPGREYQSLESYANIDSKV